MNEWLALVPGEITLLHTPPQEAMLSLVAGMAVAGPLLVLDAGNQFDAHRTARLIKRRTRQADRVFDQVRVARPFTCYQVAALFKQLPAATMPHVIFDLPVPFYDQSVPLRESRRLLRVALEHVERLRRNAPLLISVRPIRPDWPPRHDWPPYPRAELLRAVVDLADHLFAWETPVAAAPIRLF